MAMAPGLLLLGALAACYGVQPTMAKRVPASMHPATLVLLIEAAKAAMAAGMLSKEDARAAWRRTTKEQAALAAVPALLYVAQNLLTAVASRRVAGAAFPALQQTRILWTALFAHLLLRIHQTHAQLAAIALLAAAAVPLAQDAAAGTASSNDDVEMATSLVGVLCVLGAAAISGLSSAVMQRLLQRYPLPVPWVTLELAVAGAPVLLAVSLITNNNGSNVPSSVGGLLGAAPLVISNAIGGLLVGAVTKRMGGVAKGFAAIGGLAISALLQCAIDGTIPSPRATCAIPVVALATYLHSVGGTRTTTKKKKEGAREGPPAAEAPASASQQQSPSPPRRRQLAGTPPPPLVSRRRRRGTAATTALALMMSVCACSGARPGGGLLPAGDVPEDLRREGAGGHQIGAHFEALANFIC